MRTFNAITRERVWPTFLLTPTLGMFVTWAVRRYFPGWQGNGIPQTIAAARLLKGGRLVEGLLSLRTAVGQIALGGLALLGGFSVGREGPSVQIAASILRRAHDLLPNARAIRASDLVLAGGAAGIAAAFNTPLAGITYAIEELGRRFESRTSGVLLSTIMIAGLVAIALQGNYRYFGQLTVESVGLGLVPAVPTCRVVCRLAGQAFSRILLWPQRAAAGRLWTWRRRRPVAFAGLCGLAVALLGWASNGISLGSGYAVTAPAIDETIELRRYTPFARFAATVVSYFSGIPGGIFAPSLAIGAAIGFGLSRWLHLGLATHPVVAICMVGFLAASTQSPITSAMIAMEMIDGHAVVISLMATALLDKAVRRRHRR